MNEKKPCTYRDLSDADSPPKSSAEAVKRLVDSLESHKGDMLSDPKFLENILRHVVDNPDEFNREIKGEVSAASRKVERHSLRGRTNKTKIVLWLSDVEHEQLQSLVKHRGDRSPSDLINHAICVALGALRKL